MTYTVQVQLVRLGSFLCWLIGWFCPFSTNTNGVAQDSELANLVVFHAKIHTMDSTRPIAQAIALRGNRILQVGDDDAIRKRIGPQTKTIDAQGRLVLPGFNDSHVHFLQGGQQLSSVQLRTANSQADFSDRIANFAKKLKKGRWITGGDWDHENWPGTELPRRDWIDAVTPDIGVFVSRLDGHMGLANSYAMQLAEVS